MGASGSSHARFASLFGAAMALVGCGEPAAQFREYLGEVHVHQASSGAHLDAIFLGTPTATEKIGIDTIVPAAIPPSLSRGKCSIVLSPRCEEACAQGTFCAGTVCAPLVEHRLVDGGVVKIVGGSVHGDISIQFREFAGYEVVAGIERGEQVFSGGEELAISGAGATAPGFAGAIAAPAEIAITERDERSVAWKNRGSGLIKAAWSVSGTAGRYAVAVCFAEDAAESMTIPDELLALYPERPRDLQLELSRSHFEGVPTLTDPSRAVLLHASQAQTEAWHQE